METSGNMNTHTHELPNNQVVMAAVLKETSKARAKLAKPIDAAALIMTSLRGYDSPQAGQCIIDHLKDARAEAK